MSNPHGSGEEAPNRWQQVAEATNNIVTPANTIDAVAFGLAMDGANHLGSWRGISESGASLIADLIDGKVARKTGTTSEIGEALDAGGDKVKLAKFVYRVWREERAPKSLLSGVAIQNLANVAITGYDRKHNEKPQVHPSPDGKRAMFLQQAGIGLNVIGTKLAEKHRKAGNRVQRLGTAVGWTGIALGLKASMGYARQAGMLHTKEEAAAILDVFDGVISEDELLEQHPRLARQKR